MKKLFGFALAAMVSVSSIFAGALDDMGIYGKLNAGWTTGSVRYDVDGFSGAEGFSGFELYPALGLEPAATKFEDKPFDLTFEAAVDMIFGKVDLYDSAKVTAITPAVTAFFNWHFEDSDSAFLQKFVPYGGVGLAVPIQMVKFSYKEPYTTTEKQTMNAGTLFETTIDVPVVKYRDEDYNSTVVGFDLTFLVGARYALTDKIEVNAETGYNCISMNNWFLRGGALYRFK